MKNIERGLRYNSGKLSSFTKIQSYYTLNAMKYLEVIGRTKFILLLSASSKDS